MTVFVTEHAIDRYIEGIEYVDRATARQRLLSAERGIEAAARFGAKAVKSRFAKMILVGTTVVTVYPRTWIDHTDLTMAELALREAEHRTAHQRRSMAR